MSKRADVTRASRSGRQWDPRRFLGVVLGAVLVATCATTPTTAALAGSTHGRPNIVLILTDDQRWDSLWAMPQVEARLAGRGVTFRNGFVVNSLCCPSRTTILTGQYSHTTGVYTVFPPYGGFPEFHDQSTTATWLHNAGYHTGLIGKYLNDYSKAAHQGYVPPGWDRWFAFAENNGHYYDYDVSDNGRVRHYGDRPADYSTDVLAKQAVSFIHGAKGSQPLFLYFATSAPHLPATPAPRDLHALSDLPLYRPPGYDERITTDKPDYVPTGRLGPKGRRKIDRIRLDQLRTLLDADRAVGRILDALKETGRLSTTLLVFMSDNGFLWGEHRLSGKQLPYDESIRVPIIIRYDPLTSGVSTDTHLALNLDIAPTFADVAGVPAPGAEGKSLLPLLRGDAASWRTDFLVEHVRGNSKIPSYCEVRSLHSAYVLYADGESELYDLARDPFELTNVADRPSMHRMLDADALRLHQLCQPAPPGFPGTV